MRKTINREGEKHDTAREINLCEQHTGFTENWGFMIYTIFQVLFPSCLIFFSLTAEK